MRNCDVLQFPATDKQKHTVKKMDHVASLKMESCKHRVLPQRAHIAFRACVLRSGLFAELQKLPQRQCSISLLY